MTEMSITISFFPHGWYHHQVILIFIEFSTEFVPLQNLDLSSELPLLQYARNL